MPDIIKSSRTLRTDNRVMIPGNLQNARVIHADVPITEISAEEAERNAALEELEAIRAESDQTLRQAQQQREAILAQAGSQAEAIREQARREGYATALDEKRAELEGCVTQVGMMLDQLQQSLSAFIESYEKELANLSVEIVEKVIEKRIEADDLTLSELVKRAVSTIKKADWIQVEVSDQLPGLVEHLREQLRRTDPNVEIEGKKGAPLGTCVIQTPDGLVDASVSTQLLNLRESFSQITSA